MTVATGAIGRMDCCLVLTLWLPWGACNNGADPIRLRVSPPAMVYPEPRRMALPSLDVADLARRLILHEARGSSASDAVPVDRACARLRGQLRGLLGAEGVSALLRRALALAKRDSPLLSEVCVAGEPPSCFVGLSPALSAGTEEEAAAASQALLAQLLGLLVLLLGEELSMQPIRTLWPEVASSFREIGE